MDIKPERPASDPTRCPRCRGCGAIADSDDGESWLDWLDLPVKSAAAVIYGIVKPIPCPACDGRGTVEPPPPATSDWIDIDHQSKLAVTQGGRVSLEIEIPEGVTREEIIARMRTTWLAALVGLHMSIEQAKALLHAIVATASEDEFAALAALLTGPVTVQSGEIRHDDLPPGWRP